MDAEAVREETRNALRQVDVDLKEVDLSWINDEFLAGADKAARDLDAGWMHSDDISAQLGPEGWVKAWDVAFVGGPGTYAYCRGVVHSDGACYALSESLVSNILRVRWVSRLLIARCGNGAPVWSLST